MKEGAVVRTHYDEKILLLKRSKFDPIQGWCLPGGKIEEDELPSVGATRELFEETGIVTNSVMYIDSYKTPYKGTELTIHIYDLYLGEEPCITLSNEHSDYKWVTKDEFYQMDLAGNTRYALEI